jgi:hypothetical protein
MDWKNYEEVTKDIYETLGSKVGVKILGYGNSFKYQGVISKVYHQIDVLTSHSDGIHEYLTDIECKYWNDNVDKDIIMKVDSIVKDCHFNKGIIVSKRGFTPDAIAYAQSVNIGLVILREPIDEDWEGRIKSAVLNFKFLVPVLTSLEQMVTEVYINIDNYRIDTSKYLYRFPDSTTQTLRYYIGKFLDSLSEIDIDKEKHEEIKFPEETFLIDIKGNIIAKTIGIKFCGKMTSHDHNSEIDFSENIWLMMKSIFENKTFIITHEKEIKDVSI